MDPADSSMAFSPAACRGPTRKNRLLSWQGNIIRVLQAGRLRRRVYFCVTHSGWPAWEPVADVEIQCLAEPRCCAASPCPAELEGWHRAPAGDAPLPASVLLARVSGSARGAEGCWGMRILGSNLSLPESVGAEKPAPFLGSRTRADVACGFLLCRFLVSPLRQSAFLASFSFLFPFALSFGQDFNIYHRLVG